ncbi:alpha-2-macroglobulin family protein [Flavisolibacter tropicus]|uniref:Alpha-2-macroglobulin n=1 Tax=Flavisolibacter tropicus TaxID=1492898 RepID=A0A172TTL2_9BACT|nr:alpha-2-macroglobulin family protein [Flavisolibacter tropicus]ANE50370.1 alpha-2-macroglobulin [Flavisolibacter tropicus]
MKLIKPFLFLAIILCSASLLYAQKVKTYDAQWKKVNDLVQKELPKSALIEVQKIYTQAKAEGQDAQLIKALVYITELQAENREDNEVVSIRELEKEVNQVKEPATSILKSLLANRYWQYFQQQRYQLYNRTNTVDFKKEDIATWTAEDLHKKISSLYLQSLQNKPLLQSTKLDNYEAILLKGNVRSLRPTLYDLLAHTALNYFNNSERDIKKPAYAFEINQREAFAPAEEYAKARFVTNDSISLHYKALLIYQELIRFHIADKDPSALIDADIDRLQFVYQNTVLTNKDDLYKQALEQLTNKWQNIPSASQAWFLLAAYYYQSGQQYAPLKDTTNRFAIVQAKTILERIIKENKDKNEGWTNSYNLLQEINRPSYRFEIERVNVPNLPFRSLITYKNVPSLYFRIIKADSSTKKLMRSLYEDKQWDALTKTTSLRQWQQALPATNDLQEHAAEVKIDALPVGEYVLLTATNDNFGKQYHLAAQLFYVSNISYINLNNQFFILNRESGQPIANAAVQVFTQEYDYKTSSYKKQKLGEYKSDKNGFIEVVNKKEKQDNSYYLDIRTGSDFLNMEDPFYHTYYYDQRNEKPATKQIFYFTDRALYRPGQTIYVKGIVINKQGKENSIATNYKTTILLRNANYEDIDSLSVTTNEFGSFTGKFNLPQNLLNGEFSIRDKEGNGMAEFSVEEYKRPKFYVDFEKVKETYKAGDTVTVTGFAKAYAGNNIDGAKVAYRVVRQPRFIYPWLTWRWWLPRAETMEIAHGITTTDKDGKFTVRFTAIPDKKIDRKLEPVFDYRIYTDITDINGETRSGENIVSAGYKSLLLSIYTPERIAADSLKTIQVQAKNMNGEVQKATVTLNIAKLQPEQRLIRKRYWQQPDQYIMSKEEYIRLFPNDEYSNESDRTSWQKGQTIYTQTDSTRINGAWALEKLNVKPGFYQFEFITKDNEGQEVKDIKYVEVFDTKTKELAKPDYLWTVATNKDIQPGEKTSLQIGSSANDVFLVQQTDKNKEAQNDAYTYNYTTLNNEKRAIELGATEADRGGYGVSFFFVKHNRFYQYSETVSVPWSNKELDITYSTFRDKLLPGSQEKWQVKISGYKGDRAAAEVLASMYDASLDQFKPHNWSIPSIWASYYRTGQWQGTQNFSAVPSQIKWVNDRDYQGFFKQYDRFFFEEDTRVYSYNRRMAVKSAAAANSAAREKQSKAMPTTDSAAPAMAQRMEVVAVNGVYKDIDDVQVTDTSTSTPEGNSAIQIRKNLNETAFFFPDLQTDSAGNISFSFTTPEALTRWKLQTLAHTKELAFGSLQKEVVTQKELMVQPNAPRFLRQGDRLELTAKIVNLTDKEMTGQAELQLVDAATNTSVDGWFQNMFPNQYFTVAPGQSEVVKFPIEVPFTFNSALAWRVVARSGNFSDGEEAAIPVLTNKMLVTETLPLPMRGTGTKNFTFEKLLNTNSETLQHLNLSVEYTANPAWYAVQALPYLMEQECEYTEQIWNRYYANVLAMKIVKDAPRVKQIMEQWKTIDTAALLSNLQKNEDLKSALLEETPWVLQAKSETQQKKNIALLFDLVRMSGELKTTLQKLKEMQSENGGFVWIKGAPEDRYMTQYILTGVGQLKQLGAITLEGGTELSSIVSKALPYLDMKLKQDYDRLIKAKANLKIQPCDPLQAQYLYMRSMLLDYSISKDVQTAYNYYRKQAQTQWTKAGKNGQGMIALALHRTGDTKTPVAILKSLKERALISEEMGMYWKDNSFGFSWLWYHAPIETQSLLIEAFSEITKDTKAVDDMRTWLIKNKQTNNWHTTKATAHACYAMLLQGSEWLTNEPVVTVKLGGTTVSSQDNNRTEAGTGYFKKTIEPQFIKPEMGNITVTVNETKHTGASQPVNAPSWGAVYWQYFEDLDKITSAATPLKLSKKLFIEKNTDHGPVLTPVEEGVPVAVGDKIKVRVELRVDRDMEYVHMKDMRASGLEPVNVLSGYKWQGGLGYYETTKDASTNFFFPYLQKGTYVFEYPLFVSHTGNFSNGITTIQCLYAPEFSAHSEGVRLTVE